MSEAHPTVNRVSATVVIAQRVQPGREHEHRRWQAELTDRCRSFPGFVAAELVPPVPGFQDDNVVVFRFDSKEHLDAWLRSDVRRELLERGKPLLVGEARQHVVAHSRDEARPAGMVVSTRVKAGREAEYREWQKTIDAAAARFTGFLGNEVFPPVPGVQDEWVVVVRFDSAENLEGWLGSDVRRRLTEQAALLWDETRLEKIGGGFPGWFSPGLADAGRPALPPSWKQGLTVLLVLYPTVMVLSRALSPRLVGLPAAISTFIACSASVAVLTWLLMPLARRALGFWLTPARSSSRWVEVLGVGVVLLGFALAIGVFLALG